MTSGFDEDCISFRRDDGCDYFNSCLACPLIECFYTIVDNGVNSRQAMSVAIRESWRAGLRHPRFFQLYTGPTEDIPPDVLSGSGRPKRVNAGSTITREEAARAEALFDQGYSARAVEALTGRNRNALTAAIYRARQKRAKEGVA